ncbi:hypothetical protein PGB90_003992 [Kerria lacca]
MNMGDIKDEKKYSDNSCFRRIFVKALPPTYEYNKKKNLRNRGPSNVTYTKINRLNRCERAKLNLKCDKRVLKKKKKRKWRKNGMKATTTAAAVTASAIANVIPATATSRTYCGQTAAIISCICQQCYYRHHHHHHRHHHRHRRHIPLSFSCHCHCHCSSSSHKLLEKSFQSVPSTPFTISLNKSISSNLPLKSHQTTKSILRLVK